MAVCRELTKRFEEVVVGRAADVAPRFAEAARGEITVVIGPASVRPELDPAARDAVAELVAAGVGRGRAADLVSRLTGVSRNALYRASL